MTPQKNNHGNTKTRQMIGASVSRPKAMSVVTNQSLRRLLFSDHTCASSQGPPDRSRRSTDGEEFQSGRGHGGTLVNLCQKRRRGHDHGVRDVWWHPPFSLGQSLVSQVLTLFIQNKGRCRSA